MKAHVLLIFHACISAGNFSAVRMVMQSDLDPFVVIWLRLSTAFIFFSLITFGFKDQKLPKLSRKNLVILILCGLCGGILNQICFYYGLRITQPINASILHLINPITIIILSYFFLKEPISRLSTVGFVIALFGCFILLDFRSFSLSGGTFWGDILVLSNSTLFAFYVVLVSKLTGKIHPVHLSKWMMLIGLVVATPFSIEPLMNTEWNTFGSSIYISIAFVVLLNTVAAFWITNYLPTITSPYIMGMYVYLQPFLASLFAILLNQDELTSRKVFCGILVGIGIYLAQKGRRKITSLEKVSTVIAK